VYHTVLKEKLKEMKKFLMRAGKTPFQSNTALEVMNKNLIGSNVGNLIYQNSIYRTLQTDNVIIEPDDYKINPDKAAEINEQYDGYIIPLADAFRTDFVSTLENYTKLINRLTIPVYVIGVGLRAPFEPKLNEGFAFDETVKEFIKAVLNHSNIIGLRGQITSDYLTRLGFKEGIDHHVIGCPSMYTFGPDLIIRDTVINKDSKVAINNSRLSPENLLKFLERSQREFNDITFIPQWMKELKLTYYGGPDIDNKDQLTYPTSLTHRLYQEDKVNYFLSAHDWIEFLRTVDLSFGARLHGNITATIAGTPSILFPKDARMRELAEYHQLTHVMANEVTDDTTIFDLIEQVDFHSPEKMQKRNFNNYIDFLNKNDLDHIYNYGGKTDFDSKVVNSEIVHPIIAVSPTEQTKRLQQLHSTPVKSKSKTEAKLTAELKKIKQQNKQLKDELNFKNATLNRRSVKSALSLADKVSQLKNRK